MTFGEAIKTCLTKYADFTGRATRSEYWWFTLFILLISAGSALISDTLSALVSLATLLPTVAVTTRRLHDVDKSGWYQLLYFLPLIGWLILIYFTVQDSREPNRF